MKIGLERVRPTHQAKDKIEYAIRTNYPQFNRQLESGVAEIDVKELQRFRNQHGDLVDVADFDIVSRQRRTPDPIMAFDEGQPGRLFYPCAEVVHLALSIESGVQGISKGTDSKQFEQCIRELAQLEGLSEGELRARLMTTLYNTWMSVMERPVQRKITHYGLQQI